MTQPALKFTKKLGDVREKLTQLRSKDYGQQPTAEALRICYVVHVGLLLETIDTLVETLAKGNEK